MIFSCPLLNEKTYKQYVFLPKSIVYTVNPLRRAAKVLNLDFLMISQPSGQETTFLEPHSTRDPLIVFGVVQLTSV